MVKKLLIKTVSSLCEAPLTLPNAVYESVEHAILALNISLASICKAKLTLLLAFTQIGHYMQRLVCHRNVQFRLLTSLKYLSEVCILEVSIGDSRDAYLPGCCYGGDSPLVDGIHIGSC